MQKRNNLSSNVLANVCQAILGACFAFMLYRFLNDSLGIAALGVWSVVLASVSASRLAEFGLTTSVTRFVAKSLANNEPEEAAKVIDTVAATLSATLAVVLPVLYWPLRLLIGNVFEGELLSIAIGVLPVALLSVWFTATAAVHQGALDGCGAMVARAKLVIVGQFILLLLSVFMVPAFKLTGLAIAQLIQSVFLLIATRLIAKRYVMPLNMFKITWDKPTLQSVFRYGVNVQAASFFSLMMHFSAKLMMAKFGGAAAAGYYEIANQVVQRARALIVAANQAVVPHVANMLETKPDALSDFYKYNLRLMVFFCLPVFAAITASTGLISYVVVGSMELELMHYIVVLSLGWTVNTLAVPAYYSNVGSGDVHINTIVHVINGLIFLPLGLLAGEVLQGIGVVYALVIAVSIGNVYLILKFHRNLELPIVVCFLPEYPPQLWACVCSWIFGFATVSWFSSQDTALLLLASLFPVACLLFTSWFHSLRKELFVSMASI